MRHEIIRIDDSAFARYEALLVKRDAVRKSAFEYEQEYIRVFGELILAVFEKKIECIRKKKTVEYCQYFINRGKAVDQAALQEYLKAELAEYEAQLADMVKELENTKKSVVITEADFLKIKRIYHRLVKKIHPDINPETERCEELNALWHRLVIAYECNALKEMEETEVLINALLEKLGIDTEIIEVPDVREKIAELESEIELITSKDPYRYKDILESEEAVKQKKAELKAELQEYVDYSEQLEEILKGHLKGRMKITWRMN